MCKVYNTIGSLNTIQSHLIENNLDEFNSLDELINFEKNYYFTKEQVILNHKLSIQKEKKALEDEIHQLSETISKMKYKFNEQLKKRLDKLYSKVDTLFLPNSNIIIILKDIWINLITWLKIWFTPLVFYFEINFSTYRLNKLLSKKIIRYNFINADFDEALKQSSFNELNELEKKRTLLQEINKSVYGAFGEQKVENVLKKLPSDYILINDFTHSFRKPIYNRNDDEYIKTVQIDHILISPSGIFLIETKNWSEHSLKNPILRSPVDQVKRANLALYKILSKSIKHHWGDRKIPIRNLIVFINNKPTEEFHHVKILKLDELLNYITYFPACFSSEETQKIADFLLNKCKPKNTLSKLSI